MHSQLSHFPPESNSRNRQTLPPIRTIFADELARPAFPSPYSPRSASTRSSPSHWQAGSHSSSGSRSGGSAGLHSQQQQQLHHHTQQTPHQPPDSSRPLTFQPSHSFQLPQQAHSLPPTPFPLPIHTTPPPTADSSTHSPTWATHPLPRSAPPHFYSVLRPSPSGELITTPSIPRSRSKPQPSPPKSQQQQHHHHHSTDTDDPLNPRRHICPICRKRFNRPSSLRTHQSVHDRSRPYPCPHPGCTKSFSVASNMRRHLRKHRAPDTPGVGTATHGSPSIASSEGDLDMDFDDSQLASASASTSASASGHSVPGSYFEWTVTPTTRPATQ